MGESFNLRQVPDLKGWPKRSFSAIIYERDFQNVRDFKIYERISNLQAPALKLLLVQVMLVPTDAHFFLIKISCCICRRGVSGVGEI
jgi:hypothetical protein